MNSMLSKRSALTGLATLLGAIASGAVFAQEPANADVPSMTVRYADLDLANPTAVQVLYRRVETAAETVCNYGQSRELARLAAAKKCVDQALNNAIREIDVPQLNALYRAKTNRSKMG